MIARYTSRAPCAASQKPSGKPNSLPAGSGRAQTTAPAGSRPATRPAGHAVRRLGTGPEALPWWGDHGANCPSSPVAHHLPEHPCPAPPCMRQARPSPDQPCTQRRCAASDAARAKAGARQLSHQRRPQLEQQFGRGQRVGRGLVAHGALDAEVRQPFVERARARPRDAAPPPPAPGRARRWAACGPSTACIARSIIALVERGMKGDQRRRRRASCSKAAQRVGAASTPARCAPTPMPCSRMLALSGAGSGLAQHDLETVAQARCAARVAVAARTAIGGDRQQPVAARRRARWTRRRAPPSAVRLAAAAAAPNSGCTRVSSVIAGSPARCAAAAGARCAGSPSARGGRCR